MRAASLSIWMRGMRATLSRPCPSLWWCTCAAISRCVRYLNSADDSSRGPIDKHHPECARILHVKCGIYAYKQRYIFDSLCMYLSVWMDIGGAPIYENGNRFASCAKRSRRSRAEQKHRRRFIHTRDRFFGAASPHHLRRRVSLLALWLDWIHEFMFSVFTLSIPVFFRLSFFKYTVKHV